MQFLMQIAIFHIMLLWKKKSGKNADLIGCNDSALGGGNKGDGVANAIYRAAAQLPP